MTKYIFRRLAQMPILFLLIHAAPGDPLTALLGETSPPAEYVAELRQRLALDRSLPEQLGAYVLQIARGDLGYSFYYDQPVAHLILDRAGATFLLMFSALTLATILGVVVGVFAAAHHGDWLDELANLVALIGYSIPSFWLGQLALLAFALTLPLFPVGGMRSVRVTYEGFAGILDLLQHLVLPAFVLGMYYFAVCLRVTRASVMETLTQAYMTTASAKGLTGRAALFGHGLPNALLPVITMTGLSAGFAVSGAAVIEVVFSWPGLGRLMLDATEHRDYPVLMGIFIAVSISVILFSFLTDIVYAKVDPRIRLR